jgi:hypothetical protein
MSLIIMLIPHYHAHSQLSKMHPEIMAADAPSDSKPVPSSSSSSSSSSSEPSAIPTVNIRFRVQQTTGGSTTAASVSSKGTGASGVLAFARRIRTDALVTELAAYAAAGVSYTFRVSKAAYKIPLLLKNHSPILTTLCIF